MINNAKIAYAIPGLGEEPTVAAIETSIGPSEVHRNDLTLAANLACQVVTSTQTRGKITSKLAKVTRKYISSNQTLMTDTPYEVSAHIVVRYDERYTSAADKAQVIGALIQFLLSKADGTTANIVRMANGEL